MVPLRQSRPVALVHVPRRKPVLEIAALDLGEYRSGSNARRLYTSPIQPLAHEPLSIPPTSARTAGPLSYRPPPPTSIRCVISANRGMRPRYLADMTFDRRRQLATADPRFKLLAPRLELGLSLGCKAEEGDAIVLALIGP